MFGILWIAAAVTSVTALHHDRIVGGQETTIEAFPHQVSLRYLNKHICGGSIIHPLYIITAAHCIYNRPEAAMSALVGATNRKNEQSGSVHRAREIISYPGFLRANLDCDVGFVKLREPIVYGPTAQAITLVPVQDKPKHGDILFGTGWGLTSPEDTTLPEILRVAVLPVLDLDLCRKVMSTKSRITLTENMFCAGGSVGGQATYRGDSGGPIINKQNQLVGLTSWGIKNKPLGYPKLFTNLSSPKVRSFIEQVMSTIPK